MAYIETVMKQIKEAKGEGGQTMSDETELNQADFDAIAEVMHRLYPGQDGLYYGTIIPYTLGGDALWMVWRSGKASMASPTGTM